MRALNILFSIYRTILFIIVGVFILITVGPMAVGITPFVVTSDSMEPVINEGALAYVQKADSKSPLAGLIQYIEPQNGDVVAFRQRNESGTVTVIHRVLEINENGEYVMKGDNKSGTDVASVPENDIIGVYKFGIPELGNVIQLLKTQKWFVISIALMLVAIISAFIPVPPEEDDEDDEYEYEEYENESNEDISEEAQIKLSIDNSPPIHEGENNLLPATDTDPAVIINVIKLSSDDNSDKNELWGSCNVNIPYEELKKLYDEVIARH